jgi:hypothetical protein
MTKYFLDNRILSSGATRWFQVYYLYTSYNVNKVGRIGKNEDNME